MTADKDTHEISSEINQELQEQLDRLKLAERDGAEAVLEQLYQLRAKTSEAVARLESQAKHTARQPYKSKLDRLYQRL